MVPVTNTSPKWFLKATVAPTSPHLHRLKENGRLAGEKARMMGEKAGEREMCKQKMGEGKLN